MRSFISFFLPLLLTLCLCLSHKTSLSLSTPTTNFIQQTCNKSAQIDPELSYDFCVASLQAVPKSYTADLRDLGIVSLKLAKMNVSQSRHKTQKLMRHARDAVTEECLDTCLELYSEAIHTLRKSMEAFKHKNYDDANIYVSAIMDDSDTCDDGFRERSLDSPLKKENYNLFQLCAIALAITHLV